MLKRFFFEIIFPKKHRKQKKTHGKTQAVHTHDSQQKNPETCKNEIIANLHIIAKHRNTIRKQNNFTQMSRSKS